MENNEVKINSTELLSNNFFPLKSIEFEFKKKNGKTETLKREVYHSTNGATALLYNKEKRTVVLTRQFRMPTFVNNNETGLLIEACAGIVEKNEDPADAILREIEEETGYAIEKVEKIFELYSTPGAVTEMLYYFVAAYSEDNKTSDGGGLELEDEEIEVMEMPFENAYLMIRNGEIKDAKTVNLLQYARINIFKGEKVFDVL